ncbi:DNA recombination protein RmuC [Epilithonimonas bovis DSM 19482]|uniref:DNA recombination protein RmuC n=1 Tax=Epilithonimonas bovis DSM 19482 TaxID=1121284 RepID=A0A1U7PUZ9_9FLAO|nr:DNA recombination protein RmuC [Epilithonimonas bovis]SIT95813.1 DNA recombination protein RmuC [Epilithonimonas bovis DSM 19482]
MVELYIILGIVIGGILVFLLMKSLYVSKKSVEALNEKLIRSQENENYSLQKIEELKLSNNQLKDDINLIQRSKEELLFTNAELNAHYKNLQENLENQKSEFLKLQETTRLHFEKTANQILEEKSEKFTQLNQNQLKTILEPFQEKINELKNTVNETYDKEAKERFSLGEKVRELKDLNQQISEDARQLTRALKGESKTQGNWGEMILESILEKSGLRKNQEYFMEHELRDENNKAIFSEFSGKKMRPDAVVKYPDNRNVIIDSKVSLTAFVEMTDETDPDIFAIKQNQHLQSVKNHIMQLSQKAYDDFDKSLDFVMMFVPSEAAYMTALQTDPQLWNFAYDKRILLLSPTNLITSLKLVQDLWKREYQNRNAMEIAERGAKLYDKFVGFVENLERIGKNIDQAKNSYNDAFKQLSSGNDNLMIQTQKLKNLGIKNKKNLPQGLGEEDL